MEEKQINGTTHAEPVLPIFTGALTAIRLEADNLEDCREFGTQNGTVLVPLKHAVGLEVTTREAAFKVYEGDWLVKRHHHALFRLTNDEFNAMFRCEGGHADSGN